MSSNYIHKSDYQILESILASFHLLTNEARALENNY